MKIDRLMAVTIFLLNRETVSASALAERFMVSKRTIQRDIDVLDQAGIPIVSTHGANGGYQIMDGFGLTKQIAGSDDCRNIITALRGLCTVYEHGKISTTLEKVLSSLQHGGEQRVFIDFSVAREGIHVNECLRIIEKAIYDKTPLRIEYTNAEQIPSVRLVEPLALSYQWYAWYLYAYCTEKEDYRLFKLPRISRCEPTGGEFSQEHGDVELLMKNMSASDKRECLYVRLLCKKGIRQQALEYLGSNILEEYENGDFVIAIKAPFERMWFSLLMGFGDQVQVLEPDELRTLIKQKAKEILSMY